MISPWHYQGELFIPTYTNILMNKWYGFIYLIENTTTGRRYIGKKSFHTRKKRKGKPFGRQWRSDWWSYWGSSKELSQDIRTLGADKFTRTVLSIWKTEKQLSYAEEEQHFKNDVLRARMSDGSRAFYNGNIAGRYFLDTWEG